MVHNIVREMKHLAIMLHPTNTLFSIPNLLKLRGDVPQ